MFWDTSILLRQCPWICKVQLWKFLKRYDDASSGLWRCWWWRVIQLPICQPQRGGRATTAVPLCNANHRVFHETQIPDLYAHCSAVQFWGYCNPQRLPTWFCTEENVAHEICALHIVQCAIHNVAWQCNMCRVDLCAGSITQSIAHLVGRYYLLIFIEFSLLFPSAQLCTRHCHAHRG